MIQQHRPLYRALLIAACSAALFITACKKPIAPPPPPPPPPPVAAKPTATLSADRTSIKKGESVRLSWTTTDAQNVSIAPEVGAVTAQGSTTVTPADTTTYTITATGAGGSADASVHISVTVPPPPVVEAPKPPSLDELWLKEVRDAYFDYDKADIRADAREALGKTADFFRNYPQLRVTIEGHCDERGSTEYNLALGDRRASAVKAYLVSLGIPADRLSTVSYGKEKPFCTESDEACYQQNRRGHFIQTK
ncbi:MAG TPA: peptidoglycan-associated lipoprotein Pal [Candidatus Dormibacteraeota bacterium]|nr:peptidoglycan-associated lipoprotein Pal [Candidatus Dormibacteraeota bacterium]